MKPGLSVILPAFNESQRLPPYLKRIRSYLAAFYGDHYELIVVDDGSDDDSQAVLRELGHDWPQFRLLRHEQNRGKGAAVRTGMLAARGELLLFADADGATPIAEEHKLRRALEQGADIALGSRWAPGGEVQRRRPWRRRWVGLGFALLMRCFLHLPIRDTQCGFKMFRRRVGWQLFTLCRESGYLIDLEAMVWAQEIGYNIAELPVCWADVPGTKVRLFRDSWKMLRGLLRIRRLSKRIHQSKQASRHAAFSQATVGRLLAGPHVPVKIEWHRPVFESSAPFSTTDP